MNNPKLRIYGKILGEYLPGHIELLNCTIRKMSFTEQRERKFHPFETESYQPLPNSFYKSYIGTGGRKDPRIFKTNYVIFTDVEKEDIEWGAPIGEAIDRFDKVIAVLSVFASEKFGQDNKRAPLYRCSDYQISQIYELKDGKEIPFKVSYIKGAAAYINFPYKALTEQHIQDLQKFLKLKDDIFQKSLQYLISGERGQLLGYPSEKVAIDFFKSIEIIVNSLSRKKTFKQRLAESCKKLSLDAETQERIQKAWDARSNGDIAHSKKHRVWALPYQFPVPTEADMNRHFFSADLSVLVLLRYFYYLAS